MPYPTNCSHRNVSIFCIHSEYKIESNRGPCSRINYADLCLNTQCVILIRNAAQDNHPPDSYRDFADSANARLDTPPINFVAGGEIRETASVRLDFLATF